MENRIRELREKASMTQDDLARCLDVSRQTVISLEKGRYDPSIKLAFRIARQFNLPIETIFEYSGEE